MNKARSPMLKTRNVLLRSILIDGDPLPDNMKIGGECKNGHGIDGKVVRYLSGGCIACVHDSHVTRLKKDDRSLDALRHFEESQEKVEVDLW